MAEEDGYVHFSDEQIQLLQYIRKAYKEDGEAPTKEGWSDVDLPIDGPVNGDKVRAEFGTYNKGLELAGVPKNVDYEDNFSLDYIEDQIERLGERKVFYEFDGEEIIVPQGKAPPLSHWRNIDENLPASDTVIRRLPVDYRDKVEEMGYEPHVSFNQRWGQEELEELVEAQIVEEINWRRKTFPEGEIPSRKYWREKEGLPVPSTIERRIAKFSDIKQELCLEEKRTAEDVNVDVESLLEE